MKRNKRNNELVTEAEDKGYQITWSSDEQNFCDWRRRKQFSTNNAIRKEILKS